MEEKNAIEELKKQVKTTAIKRNIIIVILLIIIVLLLCLLGTKVGKIGYQDTDATIEEIPIDAIKITENDIDITKINQLNIFNNPKFNNEKIIAPQSKGTYEFCIKNQSNTDIKYDINFSDEMSNFVNMKYKLKIDNIYIKGNENEYITIENLSIKDIIVLEDSSNIFTLEWYWEDNNKLDTYIGSLKTDEYYTLKLEVNSSNYVK